MKRFSALAVFLLMLVCCTFAKEKDTMVIPLQILRSEGNLISEKTNIIKLNKVEFSGISAFTSALTDSLKKIEYNDASHFVFILTIGGSVERPSVLSYNCDIFKEPDDLKDCFWGTMSVGRCQFIVIQNDKNKRLVTSLFKKAKGQIKFIREFEYVAEKRAETSTIFDADWQGNNFATRKFFIEDEQQ